MDELELYARARVLFVSRPEARLCTRRDPARCVTVLHVEEPAGERVFRGSVVIDDEQLYRDDVQSIERAIVLLRKRTAQTVGLLRWAGATARVGEH